MFLPQVPDVGLIPAEKLRKPPVGKTILLRFAQ
jgi:hypothetical protein